MLEDHRASRYLLVAGGFRTIKFFSLDLDTVTGSVVFLWTG